jgi:lipopolysaccharide transport system permease protein
MDSSININNNNDIALNRAIVFSHHSTSLLAWKDIQDGFFAWRIWLMLAYQDIKLRYRRSILGPFWITLSMAITVYSMGFLYAHLFKTAMGQYYPFLVAGMLSWSLIATSITDLTDTFVTSDGMIKQIKLPYSLYIHRVTTRNMIIFFHNSLVMVPIYFIFHQSATVNLNTLLFLPNLLLIYVNIISFGLILAMIGARYRDISQIIKSLVQVAFFVTPIMWNPTVLPSNYQKLMVLNPFYILVQLIRQPLIGEANPLLIYGIAFLLTFIGISICAVMFSRYRSRIIYWL